MASEPLARIQSLKVDLYSERSLSAGPVRPGWSRRDFELFDALLVELNLDLDILLQLGEGAHVLLDLGELDAELTSLAGVALLERRDALVIGLLERLECGAKAVDALGQSGHGRVHGGQVSYFQ